MSKQLQLGYRVLSAVLRLANVPTLKYRYLTVPVGTLRFVKLDALCLRVVGFNF